MDAVRPSSTPLRQLACAAVLCALLPLAARPNKLVITSAPSGAAVQINGVFVGRTPYQKDIPGGYLHKTKTSLGSRLEHPMIARLTIDGYAAKEIQLTEGPANWVSLKGHNYGGYRLLKTDHFHVELQSASQTFTGGVESAASSTAEPRPELSLEELVSHTKPAVVYLKNLTKSGTGFFVTETGVIATNAHLARGEEALLATLPDGTQLEAKIIYVDPDLSRCKTPARVVRAASPAKGRGHETRDACSSGHKEHAVGLKIRRRPINPASHRLDPAPSPF